MFSTASLPPLLQKSFDVHWQRFTEVCPAPILNDIHSSLADAAKQTQLQRCWVGSEFSAELCIQHPAWLQAFLNDVTNQELKSRQNYEHELKQQFEVISNGEDILKILRQFRNQNMLRIIWRDFNRLANTQETIGDLSILADVCVQQALHFLHQALADQYGEPLNNKNEKQQLMVIAMGKHGAKELNLSSDIDLIFTYPENGFTANKDKRISNQEFFIKLGQQLIRALDQLTADGFVFRVDMRLRPYGEDGSLVSNFDALEEYYQKQGRSWERYAMIKSRIITGTRKNQQELKKILRPFTFRRYIDFSAIESLRDMKSMIAKEVKRKGYKNNIKLGSGGIREIEFIVQVFQLIRGGRESELRQRELLKILPLLSKKDLLPSAVVENLKSAYLFLRNLEHVIQGYQDKQTQLLPIDEQSLERIRFIMGFSSTKEFIEQLDLHRDSVKNHFEKVINHDEAESISVRSPDDLVALWQAKTLEEGLLILTKNYKSVSDTDSEVIAQALLNLSQSKTTLSLQSESRKRLDQFMPLLLQQILSSNINNGAETFLRLLPLVQTVLRRSAYLLLLTENTDALKNLVILSSSSPWIAEELSAHPVLLDELLDEQHLFTLPSRQALQNDLRQIVIRIPLDDLESHMEILRHFKQMHRLRIAACEITQRLPLMEVSDYLTFLAEVILQHAFVVAWHHLTQRHGQPKNSNGSFTDVSNPSFIIVAYGKMGGLELGHNSDLDVVFLHNTNANDATNGDSSIDNATFYMRLGQRIIHILETHTPSGRLYEVDTRLRPSGHSGLLVSTLKSFEKYQREQAWTWEHQALVRARVVCGAGEPVKLFEQTRQQILCLPREESTLKKDILTMRQKMRDNLDNSEGAQFHLKQGTGGIVDIEFMVQYAVLRWAHSQPSITHRTDNIRILEDLAKVSLIPLKDAQQLIESYKMLRCAAHRQVLQQTALQQASSTLAGEPFKETRELIHSLWQQLMR